MLSQPTDTESVAALDVHARYGLTRFHRQTYAPTRKETAFAGMANMCRYEICPRNKVLVGKNQIISHSLGQRTVKYLCLAKALVLMPYVLYRQRLGKSFYKQPCIFR